MASHPSGVAQGPLKVPRRVPQVAGPESFEVFLPSSGCRLPRREG